jgi:4-amino-4-deoxy-L-arabinose transferase-like glycosyltransferase
VVITAVLIGGAALRLWAISAGAPYVVGVDEPEIIKRAVDMMRTGDFNPHFFDYPGFAIYFHMIVAALRFLTGAMGREWASLNQAWYGEFYVWGRIATAALSTLTIYIVYRAGLRWGARTAILAAIAMAVHPQLVRESHYALTDTPLTLFTALTLLLSLCAAETGRVRWFLMAGMAAGLATATKYNGFVAMLMPLCAAVSVPSLRLRAGVIGSVVAGAVAAYLVSAPYSILALPDFLNGFARLMQSYNNGVSGWEAARLYMKHLGGWYGVPLTDGSIWRMGAWIFGLLCAIGLARITMGLVSRQTRAMSLTLLVFPFAYYGLIADRGGLIFARYAIPLTPAISIALGLGISIAYEAIARRFPKRRALVLAALSLVLVPQLVQAVVLDHSMTRVTTAEMAARWIVDNVDKKAYVQIESAVIQLPPDYHWTTVLRLVSHTLDEYREQGTTYLVSTSTESSKYTLHPERYGAQLLQYRAILDGTTVVATFGDPRDATWTVLKLR